MGSDNAPAAGGPGRREPPPGTPTHGVQDLTQIIPAQASKKHLAKNNFGIHLTCQGPPGVCLISCINSRSQAAGPSLLPALRRPACRRRDRGSVLRRVRQWLRPPVLRDDEIYISPSRKSATQFAGSWCCCCGRFCCCCNLWCLLLLVLLVSERLRCCCCCW